MEPLPVEHHRVRLLYIDHLTVIIGQLFQMIFEQFGRHPAVPKRQNGWSSTSSNTCSNTADRRHQCADGILCCDGALLKLRDQVTKLFRTCHVEKCQERTNGLERERNDSTRSISTKKEVALLCEKTIVRRSVAVYESVRVLMI